MAEIIMKSTDVIWHQATVTRDPKGHYRRAHAGEIRDFTGVSAPYEAPEAPQLELDTAELAPQACVAAVLRMLEARGISKQPIA